MTDSGKSSNKREMTVRTVFWGTPTSAVPYLDLLNEAHKVVAMVTQPDRPRGRGRKIIPSAVKKTARQRDVPVFQPPSLDDAEFHQQIAEVNAEVFVVVAYGQILPRQVIEIPTKAALNVHYSLLPRLRGAAPVQRALLEDLTETGITVQYISEKLDAGDIIVQQSVAIEPDDRTPELMARLTEPGTQLLAKALHLIESDSAPRIAQSENEATYAPPLTKEDGIIDWRQPARHIVNQVRACWPWPGAVCYVGQQRLKIAKARIVSAENHREGSSGSIVEIPDERGLVVRAGQDTVLIEEVQPAGRRIMSAAAYVRGARLQIGDRLQ